MPALSTLLLFSGAVLALLLSPGPNMAMVISQGLAGGGRGGIAAAAGIFAADLVMTALVCAGIATAFAAWPPSFDLLRYAGAAYLLVLAVRGLRRREAPRVGKAAAAPLARIFLSAVLVSLLNPKALLFFLVFLPQFADPQRGSIPLQLLALGLLLALIAFVFHALLGIGSGQALRLLRPRSGVPPRWPDLLHAGVLLALALRLVLLDRPARL